MAAVLAAMAAAGYGFARLVDKGRPKRREAARVLERVFSDVVETSIRAGSDVVDDPAVEELSSELMDRFSAGLATMAEDGGPVREITVLVVDSPEINAAAFPGNIVVLFGGLVRAVDGPEELAGVLAHELGHCVSNDARNAFIREVGLSVLIGASGAGQAAEAAGEMIRGAVRLRYGRRAEKRADRFAVDLLAAAGMDPAAFADALRTLADAAEGPPEWLRYADVHPPIEERIADAEKRAAAAAGRRAAPSSRQGWNVDWQAVLDALPAEPESAEKSGAGD